MTKACSTCEEVKPLTDFYKHPDHKDGRRKQCKKCVNTTEIRRLQDPKIRERIRKQKQRYRHTDRGKQVTRNRKFLARYGITSKEYEELVLKQEGCCAICKAKVKLVVDHCHVTGTVRGLLCAKCNAGIGMFNDNPEFIDAAAVYIRKWNDALEES